MAALLLLAGCKDRAKESAVLATAHVASLATLAENDVGEVERGLPEGAKRLAALFDHGADPETDAPAVRSALKRVRREVADLNKAKSTFFAFANRQGIAIRNDLEQDVMAGQDLTKPFPELARAEKGQFVTTTGSFPGTFAAGGTPDKDWVAAAPVTIANGSVGGLFVTGWTYRAFARHLQESLQTDLKRHLLETGDTGKLPILYVAVFDRSGVYSAPFTPPVNSEALANADLVGKTAAGPYQAVIAITGREFGLAAARIPKLGADTGVAVIRSEI